MSGWVTRLAGETIPISAPGYWHADTLREPVGVVGRIIPWNFPPMMAAWKLALVAGGGRIGNRGYFFPLTVLADVPDDARAMRQEPFGPLALLSRVRNIDEAIAKANSVPYGLAACAFTNSVRNVDKLSDGVEVGNLSINHFVASVAETPFGGVKDSGFGREGGIEGPQCYTVVKNVSHLMV